LGPVSDWLGGRRSRRHMPSYGGVNVELRPHKQRETVPIGLVELFPYRVNLASVGWRRIARMNRRRRIQLVGVLTSSVSSTWDLATVHAFDDAHRAPGLCIGHRSRRLAIPQSKFDQKSLLQRAAARNTRHRYGQILRFLIVQLFHVSCGTAETGLTLISPSSDGRQADAAQEH
jgi:hypothetical protein